MFMVCPDQNNRYDLVIYLISKKTSCLSALNNLNHPENTRRGFDQTAHHSPQSSAQSSSTVTKKKLETNASYLWASEFSRNVI